MYKATTLLREDEELYGARRKIIMWICSDDIFFYIKYSKAFIQNIWWIQLSKKIVITLIISYFKHGN